MAGTTPVSFYFSLFDKPISRSIWFSSLDKGSTEQFGFISLHLKKSKVMKLNFHYNIYYINLKDTLLDKVLYKLAKSLIIK